jgi:hypothetical protein
MNPRSTLVLQRLTGSPLCANRGESFLLSKRRIDHRGEMVKHYMTQMGDESKRRIKKRLRQHHGLRHRSKLHNKYHEQAYSCQKKLAHTVDIGCSWKKLPFFRTGFGV